MSGRGTLDDIKAGHAARTEAAAMPPESAYRALAGIVDESVTAVLVAFREHLKETHPDDAGLLLAAAPAAVSGAMMALVRFDIQNRTRAGQPPPTERELMVDLVPPLQQCVTLLTSKPTGIGQDLKT
jgi:hypothetical protein